MFERFTERARQVVVLAQDEARALKHNYIGTEHLLLGLLGVEDGTAAHALATLAVSREHVRRLVVATVGLGSGAAAGELSFTPRAKKVLELSRREAVDAGKAEVGTEHILLALVRENDGAAARILLDLGADAETVRWEIQEAARSNYEPMTPPVSREVADEIARARTETEQALDAQDHERAAKARSREAMLVNAARATERAWEGRPEAVFIEPLGSYALAELRLRRRAALILVLSPVAIGIGILIGWAIWAH